MNGRLVSLDAVFRTTVIEGDERLEARRTSSTQCVLPVLDNGKNGLLSIKIVHEIRYRINAKGAL